MDQGVIATCKAYYFKKTFDVLVKATEYSKMTLKEFW
jgi:hypothetical protein